MRRRLLGKTGLYVSELALGTVELGLEYGIPIAGASHKPDFTQAATILNSALDLGINFLDTARAYGDSEEFIGRALMGRRHEYILATKIASESINDLTDSQLCRRVEQSLLTSLSKLRTDYVDILLIHSASSEMLAECSKLLACMRDFVRRGMVRFVGASVYDEAGLVAISQGGFDMLQIAYSALDRRPEELLLPLAEEQGMALVARSVLLKGVLSDRYRKLPIELNSLAAAAARLEEIACESGMSLPELAYRYVQAGSVVSLCGTCHLHELKTAIDCVARGPLDPDVIARVRTVIVVDSHQLNPGNWLN